MCIGESCCLNDVHFGYIVSPIADVLGNGNAEEDWLLRDKPDLGPKPG